MGDKGDYLGSPKFDFIKNLGTALNGFNRPSSSLFSNIGKSSIHSALSLTPWGNAVSGGLKAFEGIGSALGWNLDSMDRDAADRLGIDTTMDDIANAIPGLNTTLGIFSKNTDTANVSSQALSLSSGYGGTSKDLLAGLELSDKKVLNANAVNKKISENNNKNELLTNIALDTGKRRSSSYSFDLMNSNRTKYSGLTPNAVQIGRDGFKMLDAAKNIIKSRKNTNVVEKFQDGGKLNVIVEGALHARLNKIDETNPEIAEEITKKGVPVVSVDSDNKITQMAEVEVGELILTKEITDKLEELFKDGSEKAAIKAGKILAKEIIEYTEDLTEELLEDED